MSAEKKPDLLSLEADLGLTEADLRALRASRPQAWPNWWDQLTLLSEQFPEAAEAARHRRGFEGCEPFEL